MNKYLFKKPQIPDFSKSTVQREFIKDALCGEDLIKKELEVNGAEQVLLSKRITMMQSFVNDLSINDPQYNMLLIQIQMDQLEFTELKLRETSLIDKLEFLEENK